jgi:hypothetical protein
MCFLVPEAPKRSADRAAVEVIATVAGIRLVRINASMEAGNLLVDDECVLVGEDARSQRSLTVSTALDRADDPLVRLAGSRSVVFVGAKQPVPARSVCLTKSDGRLWIEECFAGTGRRQPVFHLDMFMSLAGRDPDGRLRVLVGDTRMASTLVGAPALADMGERLADRLDETAEQLRDAGGFAVIRNPLPLICSEDAGLLDWSRVSVEREFAGVAGADEVLDHMQRYAVRRIGVRRWYFATQNNAVGFRTQDGGGAVLLPTYAHGRWRGLAAAERRNAEI